MSTKLSGNLTPGSKLLPESEQSPGSKQSPRSELLQESGPPSGSELSPPAPKTISRPLWKSVSTEILFFSLIAGMSVMGGFGMTLTMAKKRDPNWFTKGLVASKEISESGGSLALRALGLGSLYAVGGFSVCCLLAWKISGVHSMEELRVKVANILPAVPKHEPKGRSEFKSLRDLVNFLIEEDELKKARKKDS